MRVNHSPKEKSSMNSTCYFLLSLGKENIPNLLSKSRKKLTFYLSQVVGRQPMATDLRNVYVKSNFL
eukprot:UN16728